MIFEPEHEQLRQTARQYIEREVAPNAEKWERERIVDRSAYLAAGKYGLIGFNMPEQYGGGDPTTSGSMPSSMRNSLNGDRWPGAEPAERRCRPVLQNAGH
ncbi:acyl-CoA dehydrogenase, N-terminal domain protein [Mycobacterium xenopi 4042]|uniref:Acyl-CoA dehydrogenase, N-terminal domain protein n=1 Tax=Mycobacterium xenopi 4042 TaxID=1299334 RepID=X8AI95_MYCXE|nr:acyl-CoA dehydrogenase, N-terminal domain protein [Mycobacterium xenopi 4042]